MQRLDAAERLGGAGMTEPMTLDAMWERLWDDLRRNATGHPSGQVIIQAHRPAIEREAAAAAPLDVERLARAFDTVWREDGWEPTHPNSRLPAEEAERIAREYDLLAGPLAGTTGRPPS